MPQFILDTDTLTLFQHRHPRVQAQVRARSHDAVALSAWTVEEQMSGWLASCRSARTPAEIVQAYQYLPKLVESWSSFLTLPATSGSLTSFNLLVKLKLNVGRFDLRIAATALDAGATVVTRNRRDFGRVPGLTLVDWSV